MVIDYKKIFILIILLFLGFADVKAGNAYKNELTKVGLTSIGSGDVKVTLYMAKPYTEPLRLLKKNDGEFVLILPETYTSAPQKPSISDVIGEVTDADIKLYSFVSNTTQNGYTKIVIKTNGLANLYPETVTTGGGTLHKTQSQVNKIISEQIKPTQQTTQVLKTENKVGSANIVQQQIKVPELKIDTKKDTKTDNKVDKKADNKVEVKKEETKNQELKPEEQKEESIAKIKETDESQSSEDVKNLPNNTENNIEQEPIKNIVGEKTTVVLLPQRIKNKLSSIKAKVIAHIPNVKDIQNQTGNIFVTLIALILVVFSIKFAIGVLKNSGQKQNDLTETKAKDKKEYSEFFKNIIESEFAEINNSVPKILSVKRDYTGIEIEPQKSHQEVMNIDQNLSWQEKFRALQANRKSLLQDNKEDVFSSKDKWQVENIENMNTENPIKKLTHDFKAVKKVLEKQYSNKNVQNTIKQDFTPEKIENIEIIKFEDLQKTVQRPRVKLNTTAPIKPKAPKILTKLKLDDNKGFYLVDYKGKISLIGYINDNIYKLNSYSSVKTPKLFARLTDKTENTDTYIVKIDNSKLLVDVDNEQMKLKLIY